MTTNQNRLVLGAAAIGFAVACSLACGKSGGTSPTSMEEPVVTAAADALTFGVEGMRRVNGAL